MPRAIRPKDLEHAASRLAVALGDAGMLVGGLAVSAWGYVRATDDIDFVANLPASAVVERLESAGIKCRVRKGSMLEGDIAWCVSGKLGGVVFDVLPPLVPLDFDRAVTVTLARGNAIRVVDLDGLLRLKLRAGGPQDLLDAAQLLRRHPELVERIRPIAVAYSLWDRLEAWMKDPRLR
jgi:hypothetical protein